LRRLTWSDSAALLERLARSEAVHAVRGWFDLKDRLDDDRRVYAFFHPALPGTPLVFTEVALTDEMPASIRAILNKDAPRVDPTSARCATFYSISNCESGLTGIPFGNALIKHAVEQLRGELPRLRTFATLSPLPGFAAWVRSLGDRVAPEVRAALATPGWHRNGAASATLREPLLRLAARYLLAAKRDDGAPRDAVARFHLANGALIERIDWLADPAQRGVEQSFGVMVNYRYALDRYPANQLAYATNHAIDASPAVKALALADPTVLEEAQPGVSRRAALLAALRGVASRAKRIIARAPARA
jgi:malonyl-CoA decarboxylase